MRKLDKEHLKPFIVGLLFAIGVIWGIYYDGKGFSKYFWFAIAFMCVYIPIALFWLFPKVETHETYTPDKDGENE